MHYIPAGEQISKWNKALAKESPGVSVEIPSLKSQVQLKAKWEHANRAKTIDKEITPAPPINITLKDLRDSWVRF